MGELEARLARLRSAMTSLPPSTLMQMTAVFDERERAARALRSSGLHARIPGAGSPLPEFALPDSESRVVRSGALLRAGPLVISRFPGSSCAFSAIELMALGRAYPQIRAAGAELVAISPLSPEDSAALRERCGLPFALLADRGCAYTARLELAYDVPPAEPASRAGTGAAAPSRAARLVAPARIVVDPAGVIRAFAADPDPTKRTEPSATLTILGSLR